MKHKIGDTVVLIVHNDYIKSLSPDYVPGYRAVVTDDELLVPNSFVGDFLLLQTPSHRLLVRSIWVESEIIYDSPLAVAMREE